MRKANNVETGCSNFSSIIIVVYTHTAQMDMTKTPAFRAVEELVRAQNTHMKLRREFEEAKLSEDIAEMKEVRHCICACVHIYCQLTSGKAMVKKCGSF